MNNPRNDTSASFQEAAEGATFRPGAALAAARHARGIAIEDVARALKLSVAQAQAIEADDPSAFSAAVFARGFLRGYARLLDVDIEPLLPPKTVEEAHPDMRLQRRIPGVSLEPRRNRHLPVMAAASVLLLGGLSYYEFVLNAPPGPVQMATVANTTNVPTPSSVTDHPSAVTPVIVPPAELQWPSLNAEHLRLKTSADPMSGANTRGLHFTFNNESWVEVRDALGKVVYSRLNAPGSESVVQGEPPFSIVIGGASGVQLSYNGNRVDIASYMSEDVARLRLE